MANIEAHPYGSGLRLELHGGETYIENKEVKMEEKELKQILDKHTKYLNADPDGECADLRYANLLGTNLSYANLKDANLKGVNLRFANLTGANLTGANLRSANLKDANLKDANLKDANLKDANLKGVNLRYANLTGANLKGSDLRDTALITFQFQRDFAYCIGDKLTIGCESHTLNYWLNDYEMIGDDHHYSDLEIKMYGMFIKQCAELNNELKS